MSDRVTADKNYKTYFLVTESIIFNVRSHSAIVRALAQIDRDPQWLLNIMWTDEAHFSLHGDVNTQNCRIWVTSNPHAYITKPLHSPHVTVWCSFTASFILGPFF